MYTLGADRLSCKIIAPAISHAVERSHEASDQTGCELTISIIGILEIGLLAMGCEAAQIAMTG